MNAFRGVYAAMLSPFAQEGTALDGEALAAYCGFLIDKGANGLFPFGTTGEWPHLSEAERMRGAEIVVKAARSSGRDVKVVVHAGAHTTEQVRRLCAHARGAGADAVAIIAPPYYYLDEDALFEHFSAAAREEPDLPVFVYSIPAMTRSDISPALLLRIREAADNVVGIKYSGSSILRLREYRRVMGDSFALFIGDDNLALPALYEGADGIVSGNASAVPDMLAGLYGRFSKGEGAAAAASQAELDAFIGGMDESAELSCFKHVVSLRGVPLGDVRPPLKRLSAEGKAAVAVLVRNLEERGVIRRQR